jgi:hypothetical protein
MASKSHEGGNLEGLGGPVSVDKYHFDGIDPTLDSCCQREVSAWVIPCIFVPVLVCRRRYK